MNTENFEMTYEYGKKVGESIGYRDGFKDALDTALSKLETLRDENHNDTKDTALWEAQAALRTLYSDKK